MPFPDNIKRQGTIIVKKIIYRKGYCMEGHYFRVLLKQWIKYNFRKIFMRQGTGCEEICHTPRHFPSQVVLFKNDIFLLSCGRLKIKLFENSDVTASICYISVHALESVRVMRGHSASQIVFYRSSNIEFRYRITKSEYHSGFVWTGIFSKNVQVWTRIFFIRMKKAFSRGSRYM